MSVLRPSDPTGRQLRLLMVSDTSVLVGVIGGIGATAHSRDMRTTTATYDWGYHSAFGASFVRDPEARVSSRWHRWYPVYLGWNTVVGGLLVASRGEGLGAVARIVGVLILVFGALMLVSALDLAKTSFKRVTIEPEVRRALDRATQMPVSDDEWKQIQRALWRYAHGLMGPNVTAALVKSRAGLSCP